VAQERREVQPREGRGDEQRKRGEQGGRDESPWSIRYQLHLNRVFVRSA
jgi:hypothetical protein